MKRRKSSLSNPIKMSLDLSKIIEQREKEQAGKQIYKVIQDAKTRSQSNKSVIKTSST